MSQAILRDVSPIHREYLRNMGIDASMSISIIRDGKLWGLFACHHYSPRILPRHLRAVCELFGSMFSLQLEAAEKGERFEERLASRMVLPEPHAQPGRRRRLRGRVDPAVSQPARLHSGSATRRAEGIGARRGRGAASTAQIDVPG